LCLVLAGDWTGSRRPVTADDLRRELAVEPALRRLTFETEHLGDWDSGLLTFLLMVKNICAERQVVVEDSALPEGVRRLLALAAAVPERGGEHLDA